MKNKVYIGLLAMLSVLPLAINGAEMPPEKTITVQTIDGKEFKIPKRIANLSRTLKHWIKDVPNAEKYEFEEKSGITNDKFRTIISLLQIAEEVKDKPLRERIQKVSDAITKKFAQAPMDQWVDLFNDISFLDIEILEAPFADSMIKYLYRTAKGDRRQLEKEIEALNIPEAGKKVFGKYWYFNYGNTLTGRDANFLVLMKIIKKTEHETIKGFIHYDFSIEELAEHNKLPAISHDTLNLKGFNINDLTGFNRIPNLTSVKYLNLKENNLKTLPENIFRGLTMLRSINLRDNQLATLPLNIFDELHGCAIYLEGNPLKLEIKEALKNRYKNTDIGLIF